MRKLRRAMCFAVSVAMLAGCGDRKKQRKRNMHQVGLALTMYVDAHGKFARSSFPIAPGKPPASWRVHLLPYLDGRILYDQYNFDEPWDSEHNKQLIAKMPEVYGESAEGKTRFLLPVGKGTIIGADTPLEFGDVKNETIWLVEVAPENAVVWTKPQDMPYDPQHPLAGLGETDGEFLAVVGAVVRSVETSTDSDTLRAMFSYASQEKKE